MPTGGTRAAALAHLALDPNDTIAAIASPPGPAARGIVRLSGPNAHAIALAGFEPSGCAKPTSRRRASIRPGSLKVGGLRPLLPVMMSIWPAPRTYTGQDVAEIHLVGSAPLCALVLSDCIARGARPAERGEFTLRAFLSGRIDLTQAEAVHAVIEARNQAQLDAALEQLAGGIADPITALRDRLLEEVAHLEANLDFTEEPDVDPVSRAALVQTLEESAATLSEIAAQLSERERTVLENRVVLAGPPNAGKSRLFNALLGRDRAIVSPIAGTTRDYLCEECHCDGLVVLLVDAAGFAVPDGAVETQAQRLRAEQLAQADLLLECRSVEGLDAFESRTAHQIDRLCVWTKADLAVPDAAVADGEAMLMTSAVTGAGLPELRSAIARTLRSAEVSEGSVSSTGARCGGSLKRAAAAIRSAAATIADQGGDELVAFELRLAIDELGSVIGAVVTDDILDLIFRRFCIGK
jgi:tRNA modification GTPase